MRDFGNQAMSVAAIENARHLGALTAWIGDVLQMGRVLEFLPDVGIGDSADHVLTIEQSAKDLSFIARQRIEGFCGPLWSHLFAGGNAVQSTDGVGWIFNLGQGGEVTAVG